MHLWMRRIANAPCRRNIRHSNTLLPAKQLNGKTASGSHSGEVVAAQPYQVGSQNCRQYTHTVRIDGTPQSARGTACRNEDGSWTPLT